MLAGPQEDRTIVRPTHTRRICQRSDMTSESLLLPGQVEFPQLCIQKETAEFLARKIDMTGPRLSRAPHDNCAVFRCYLNAFTVLAQTSLMPN
jgi:hypothetical protein